MSANDQKTLCTQIQRALAHTPAPKFKKLAALAASGHNSKKALPLKMQSSFIRITSNTIAVNLLLAFDKSGATNTNFYGRVTNANHQTLTWFENSVSPGHPHAQQLLLPPGTYRLQIATSGSAGSLIKN